AESFGATGLRVEKAADLGKVLDKAFATQGPVVVDIPVDYSDNPELGKQLIQDNIN
ncbi:thiamine pyrophosphate-dependent enzyme, partial [uncultured Limosilactobacillus sp.]